MPVRSRYRVVIPNVGVAFVEAALPIGFPYHGVIRRFTATADILEDPGAALGTTAANDIRAEFREGNGAVGFGGVPGVAVGAPLRYALTPLNPDLTIDSQEDVDYWGVYGSRLYVAVALNQQVGGAPDATVVVVVTIEEHEDGAQGF